ncbi:DoxX family protein [Paraflavitalea sp. CAU 1676]|uniref:DoxX family protein n=1 Tax=Paraflavitalea sp. CAU 1676 TaxID=3032598 RepID=UPI0023DB8C1D|nr:DoxX family protein [Paraflavitalea sp. CAU 1676]MDF2188346.1 DoxX family protein [Paraflavitalea sp. CAU 1676]
MYVLLAIAFSLVGFLLSFLRTGRHPVAMQTLSLVVLWLALIVTAANALVFFAGLPAGILKNGLLIIYNGGKAIWFLPAVLLASLLARGRGADNLSVLRRPMLAAAILCAGFFFMVTIGKWRHLDEMKTFFLQSGYPVYFLYLNMGVECLASAGLLLHRSWRWGMVCAIVLLLMMLAAVFTHVRNGDPITDSYDAFMQLLLLLLLTLLLILERKYKFLKKAYVA